MAVPPDLLELVRQNVRDSGKSDLAHLFKRAELPPCVQGTLGLRLRFRVTDRIELVYQQVGGHCGSVSPEKSVRMI